MTDQSRTPTEWSRRLVALLTAEGHLDYVTAETLLADAAHAARPVASELVRRGIVEGQLLLDKMAAISGMEVVDIFSDRPAGEAFAAMPESLAREFSGIGYQLDHGRLTLACVEPLSPAALRSLSAFLDCEAVGTVLADPAGIERILDAVYARLGEPTNSEEPVPAGSDHERADDSVNERVTAAGSSGADSPDEPLTRTVPPAVLAPPPRLPEDWELEAELAELAAVGATCDVGSAQADRHQDGGPAPVAGGAGNRAPETAAAAGMDHDGTGGTAVDRSAEDLIGTAALAAAFAEACDAEASPDPMPPSIPATPRHAGRTAFGPPPKTMRPFAEYSDGSGGFDINDLLIYAVEHGASDLHLTSQLVPAIRIDGSIRPIEGVPRLSNEQIREMVFSILPQAMRERFEAERELDTSHTIHGVGRFRVNVFLQRGSVGAVLRAIPHEIPAFSELGLPEVIASFADLRRGLVLVTGPTGSGKSTTLASVIDIINRTKPLHIMTVEDPIEFLHDHQRCIVNQREVGQDTFSFAEALRHVLRQDPDVILVGEMRDIETISTALTAAETGHLVLASLHTQDAPQTIDRIIDVFPTAQQGQIRVQLAATLEAVVTQQLIIGAAGIGRTAVSEIMVCTPAIRNLIRSSKTHQVYSLMQTGNANGMQTMDQGLAKAVQAKRITEAVAYDRCHDPNELREYLMR